MSSATSQIFTGRILKNLLGILLTLASSLAISLPAHAYILVIESGPVAEGCPVKTGWEIMNAGSALAAKSKKICPSELTWQTLAATMRNSEYSRGNAVVVLRGFQFQEEPAEHEQAALLQHYEDIQRGMSKPSYVLWRGDLGAASFDQFRHRFNSLARALRRLGVSAPFILATGSECGDIPAEVANAPFALQGPLVKVFMGPDFRNPKAKSCGRHELRSQDVANMWLTAMRDADYKYAKIRRETLLFLFDWVKVPSAP